MKYLSTLVVMLSFIFNSYSQDKISVRKSSNGSSTFIETHTYYSAIDSYRMANGYRLGPRAAKDLKEGIKKALNWVELNNEHHKTFSKEICRIKVIDKTIFDVFGYSDLNLEELTIVFYGYSDASFKVEVLNKWRFAVIKIEDYDMLNGFKKLIDGKSANREIDEIFK